MMLPVFSDQIPRVRNRNPTKTTSNDSSIKPPATHAAGEATSISSGSGNRDLVGVLYSRGSGLLSSSILNLRIVADYRNEDAATES
jgi:hypothetical protein